MKSTLTSTILGAIGLISPLAGLHRFYLDRPLSGVLYVLTWGFFGIGTVIDLVRMPSLVARANARELSPGSLPKRWLQAEGIKIVTPEREVLEVCKRNEGIVTVQMIALETSLSLSEAKSELARLQAEGYCTIDIDEEGVEIYHFNGLSAGRPLLA